VAVVAPLTRGVDLATGGCEVVNESDELLVVGGAAEVDVVPLVVTTVVVVLVVGVPVWVGAAEALGGAAGWAPVLVTDRIGRRRSRRVG
jgi:hypothetical protein